MSDVKKYQEVSAEVMAEKFAKSGFFSSFKDPVQAFVAIQAGRELGFEPFQSITNIHIINGRPQISAGLMASMVKKSPKYDFRTIETTDKKCVLQFFEYVNGVKEKLGEPFVYTIEDAKKEGVKFLEKMPRDMLFARCLSKGVRTHCPDVTDGPVYVHGEFEQEIAIPKQSIQSSQKESQIPADNVEFEEVEPNIETSTNDELRQEQITDLFLILQNVEALTQMSPKLEKGYKKLVNEAQTNFDNMSNEAILKAIIFLENELNR